MAAPFVISPASPDDYPAFTRLFPELAVPEAAPLPEYFARAIVPDALLLRVGADVAGYVWARRRGDRLHVVNLVVDPAHRGRGVGRALMDAAAARASAAGLTRWMLNVKPENVAARALYEQLGMRVSFASVSMRLEWADVPRLAAPAGVLSREIGPADDPAFEDALAMARGEVSAFRALGRVIVGASAGDGPAGLVAFDPAMPGASPFRVRAPDHARALLEGIRPHVPPGQSHLFVFVEGHPELEAWLTAAGAQPALRTLRMEGDFTASQGGAAPP